VGTFDPLLGGLLLFGGRAPNGSALGDTWASVGGQWTPLHSSDGRQNPAPRWGAAMTYDSSAGYVLLFGGRNASGLLADSWTYNATGWHSLSLPRGPSPRAFAAIAYDPALGGVVLFGGVTGASSLVVSNQTWLFASAVWSNLGSHLRISPAARAWASAAYDPLDGYLLLFGGALAPSSAVPTGDTWALSAGGWSNLSAPAYRAPSPRSAASLNFDPQAGGVVLFGGASVRAGGTLSFPTDTWSFRAGTWSNLTPSLGVSPLGREGAVWGPGAGAGGLLLVGGADGAPAAARSDVWQFSAQALAASVTASPTAGPAPLNVTFALSISGGNAPYNVSWEFGDGTVSTAPSQTTHLYGFPGNFSAKVSVTDSAGDSATESIPIAVLTAWEGAHQWSNVGSLGVAAPSPRASAQVAYDPALQAVILFGGDTSTGASADTWEFVDNIWINLTSSLPTAPSARFGGTMVYDSVDSSLVLFGGTAGSTLLNDTWEFNGATWTLAHPTVSPSSRAFAQMAYDPLDGYVVLFGGTTSVPGIAPVISSDTWEFRAGFWVNITSQLSIAPPPTSGGTLTWDLQDSDLVLSGGSSIAAAGAPGTCYPNGLTWTYVGGAWTEQDAAGPTERVLGMSAYDSVDHVVLLYGGSESRNGACAVGDDTWSYVGGGWSNLSGTIPFPPAARDRGALVFDAAEGVDVLFGGATDGVLLNDTWLYPAELNPTSTTTTSNTTNSGSSGSGHPPPGGTGSGQSGSSGSGSGNPPVSPFAVGYSLSSVSSTGPLTVTFEATALGGVPPFVFSWNFGDSSPTMNGSPVDHRYTVAGTFVPVLTATDSAGQIVIAVLASIHVAPEPSTGLDLTPPSETSGPSIAEWATMGLVAGGVALAGVVLALRRQELRCREEGEADALSFE
jgi:PKD repeat protein